jgi:hypothetical protein
MRNLHLLDNRRIRHHTGGWGDETCGAFLIPGPCGRELRVIASAGEGWDHVSVSLHNRCPNWHEMAFIKGLFFDDEEAVVQFHPPKSQYVNFHPYCLHLWRPLDAALPLPPMWMVGPSTTIAAE